MRVILLINSLTKPFKSTNRSLLKRKDQDLLEVVIITDKHHHNKMFKKTINTNNKSKAITRSNKDSHKICNNNLLNSLSKCKWIFLTNILINNKSKLLKILILRIRMRVTCLNTWNHYLFKRKYLIKILINFRIKYL
jgi:predicted protein tyrosine phosphatase